MFAPVKFCCLCYFELQGRKRKKIFPKFRPDRAIAGIQHLNCNATTNDSKPKKTN